MAVVLDGLDGYVFDNLAWGGTWDVDPHDVVAPTVVWDGEGEGARGGRWYADEIAHSGLMIFPGEGHLAGGAQDHSEHLGVTLGLRAAQAP